MAVRTEYLEDLNGLFSGVPQYLREGTLKTVNVLRSHQDTATLGQVWWLGQKTGPW